MDKLDSIVSDLVFLLVVLAVLGFTGWVFWLTRNPWSFSILILLSGFSTREPKKDEEK